MMFTFMFDGLPLDSKFEYSGDEFGKKSRPKWLNFWPLIKIFNQQKVRADILETKVANR